MLTDGAWSRLCSIRCVVAGVGGLGSVVVMLLARLGPITIDLWDPALLDEPDLNRQLLYSPEDIGTPKAVTAARYARRANPQCTVSAYEAPLTASSFEAQYADNASSAPLVLFDCVDTLRARAAFEEIRSSYGVTVFHGGVEGWYGQATTHPGAGAGYNETLPGNWRKGSEPGKPIMPHVVSTVASAQIGDFVQWLERPEATPLSSRLLYFDGRQLEARGFRRGGTDA